MGGCASVAGMSESGTSAAVADEAALVAGLKRAAAGGIRDDGPRLHAAPAGRGAAACSATTRTRATSCRTRCCRRTDPSTSSKAIARVDLAAPDRRQRGADEAPDAAPEAGGIDRAAAADVPRGRALPHELSRVGGRVGQDGERNEMSRSFARRFWSCRTTYREVLVLRDIEEAGHRGDRGGAGYHAQCREDSLAPRAPGLEDAVGTAHAPRTHA